MQRDLLIVYSTILVYTGVGMIPLALQVIFLNKVGDFWIALFMSAYWLASFFSSPIWGMLSDITGKRKLLLLLTTAISAFTALMHAFYIDYTITIILRFIFGFFLGAYLPISLSILLENTSKEESGKKSSLFNTSRAIGFLFSGYVTSIIIYLLDVRDAFIISSAIMALSLIFIATLKCDNDVQGKDNSNRRIIFPGSGFIRNYKGHLLVIALALRHTTIMGLFSLIFVYMLRRGIPDYLLGTLSSLNNLTQIILMYPMGYLADKFGRKPMFTTGLLLSAIVPLLLIYSSTPLSFALIFVIIGVSFSSLIAGVTPFLKDIAPEGREAESMSFLSIARGFGSIVGPIIVGLLVTWMSYEVMYIVISIITFIAFAISLLTEETLRDQSLI